MEFNELQATETVLEGYWLDLGSRMEPDAVCARIDWLVKERLKLCAESVSACTRLYRDPADGRFWEYSHRGAVAAGPPALAVIAAADAEARYGRQAVSAG